MLIIYYKMNYWQNTTQPQRKMLLISYSYYIIALVYDRALGRKRLVDFLFLNVIKFGIIHLGTISEKDVGQIMFFHIYLYTGVIFRIFKNLPGTKKLKHDCFYSNAENF